MTLRSPGVLTTGLSGTAAAVKFPPGYGVALVATAVATTLAAVLAALIARRDALVVIPAALGIWFAAGVGAGIAGIELSHPDPAHWGVVPCSWPAGDDRGRRCGAW